MACNLTQDIELGCRDSVGGIKRVYIAQLEHKNTLTVSSGTVSTFTLIEGNQFWIYDFRKQTGNAVETGTGSTENGSVFYSQTVTFPIDKMQASLREELALLIQNRVMIIVLDRNGKYHLFGKDNGLDLNTLEANTGTAMGDRNGYTLTFNGAEEDPAPEVDSSLISSLTAPAL